MNVKMNFEGNLGYAADQVSNKMTLADLLTQVEEAIEKYGEDAEVVSFQTNNRYGACYGSLDQWSGLFTSDEDDVECEECGGEQGFHADDCPEA